MNSVLPPSLGVRFFHYVFYHVLCLPGRVNILLSQIFFFSSSFLKWVRKNLFALFLFAEMFFRHMTGMQISGVELSVSWGLESFLFFVRFSLFPFRFNGIKSQDLTNEFFFLLLCGSFVTFFFSLFIYILNLDINDLVVSFPTNFIHIYRSFPLTI